MSVTALHELIMLPDYAEPNVDRVSSLRPACVIRPDLHLIEHGPLAPLITGWAKSATKWKFYRYFKDYLMAIRVQQTKGAFPCSKSILGSMLDGIQLNGHSRSRLPCSTELTKHHKQGLR